MQRLGTRLHLNNLRDQFSGSFLTQFQPWVTCALPKESEPGLGVLTVWVQVVSRLAGQNIVLALFMSVYFYHISLPPPHPQTTGYISKMIPKKNTHIFSGTSKFLSKVCTFPSSILPLKPYKNLLNHTQYRGT